jgi:hypothetical protein
MTPAGPQWFVELAEVIDRDASATGWIPVARAL